MTGKYTNIERAHLEIAADNGGINRDRSPEAATKELYEYIDLMYTPEELKPIDDWLGTLSDEELETICCGDEADARPIFDRSEVAGDAEDFLAVIFEHVC